MTMEWLRLAQDWLAAHQAVAWWLAAASVVTFVVSLVALPVLVAEIPADYFVRKRPIREHEGHWVLRTLWHVAKNLLGVTFVLAGVVMLFTPGQGILTVLVGVVLMDFPGKRRLELALARQEPVHRSIDWMRARRGRPPLELP